MSFWTRDSIKRVVGGQWLSRGQEADGAGQAVLAGLSTDTRTVARGQVFLALRGERFDGHQFLRSAAESGAGLLIIDDESAGRALVAGKPAVSEVYVLRVADTGRALLKLAAAYRASLERTRVVGVVGSNGKTTTARLIASVLAAGGVRGTASPKSFNNAVGVPLTILSASPSDQFLVCEIGTNAPGEIGTLAEVVRPDVVVITSIGREHLEGFGTIDGVAREEGSVLRYLNEGALVIAPSDLPTGAEVLEDMLRAQPNVLRFGTSASADLRAANARHVAGRLTFSINGRLLISMSMLGEHNALNALAAFAVARRFGVEESKIVQSLGIAAGAPMRLELCRVTRTSRRSAGDGIDQTAAGEVVFINDAYNANPESVLAALATFESVMGDWPGVRRRVVMLGDMRELGSASEDSHREIGRRISTMRGIDRFLLVGPMMRHAYDEACRSSTSGTVLHVPGLDDAAMIEAADQVQAGDLVLLKGSRGTRMERVILAARGELPTVTPVARTSIPTTATLPQQHK